MTERLHEVEVARRDEKGAANCAARLVTETHEPMPVGPGPQAMAKLRFAVQAPLYTGRTK